MTAFQTFIRTTVEQRSAPFIEGDPEVVTRHRVTRKGVVVHADGRPEAVALARSIHGPGFAGVEAIGVECLFCEDRPVGNAERWTDADAPATAPCPRCGVER